MAVEQENVLLAVTGSVAAIKTADLSRLLTEAGFSVTVVCTKAALHFFDKTTLSVPVYEDADEYSIWKNRGDDVLHIKLRNWADILLIAPISANTLAKISTGIADNLISCIARAWFFDEKAHKPDRKLGIFAPAMNTSMWNHPLTTQHLRTMQDVLHWKLIPPIEKQLMCGEFGCGAMEEPAVIVNIVKDLWDKQMGRKINIFL